ncbi:MAG: Hsp20/alpha crystallin family protein [Candidatus Limnocylindrales bacterium]
MMIRHTSPFGELLQLRRAMERMFDDPFARTMSASRSTARRMPLDVYETPEAIVIEAALPGIRPEEVEVSVLGDTLTLSAGSESESRSDENGGYRWREVQRGKVTRSVTLPQGVVADGASATFENGLLRLSVPKAQPAEAVRIPVTVPVAGEAARIDASSAPDGAAQVEQATGQEA